MFNACLIPKIAKLITSPLLSQPEDAQVEVQRKDPNKRQEYFIADLLRVGSL